MDSTITIVTSATNVFVNPVPIEIQSQIDRLNSSFWFLGLMMMVIIFLIVGESIFGFIGNYGKNDEKPDENKK